MLTWHLLKVTYTLPCALLSMNGPKKGTESHKSALRTCAVHVTLHETSGVQVMCMEGHDVAVHMQGPCTVALVQEAGSQGHYTAQLPTSGTYLAHVQISGHTLAGWPRIVHVTAGASDASRCPFVCNKHFTKEHTVGCYGASMSAPFKCHATICCKGLDEVDEEFDLRLEEQACTMHD